MEERMQDNTLDNYTGEEKILYAWMLLIAGLSHINHCIQPSFGGL